MDEVYIDIRKENEWIRKYFDTDFVSIETLLATIEDLDDEIEHWKEKYEDLEEDLRDNYRPIPYAEQVGVSDRDFIESSAYRW